MREHVSQTCSIARKLVSRMHVTRFGHTYSHHGVDLNLDGKHEDNTEKHRNRASAHTKILGDNSL